MPYERKMLETGDTFTYKSKTITVKEPTNIPLNKLQQAHVSGSLSVYAPIESYTEKWKTVTKQNGYWEDYVSAHPVPNTRKRNDLPPIASQWRDSYKKGK